MSFCRLSIIAVILLGTASLLRAQSPDQLPSEPPGPMVAEAFALPYGQALIAELGKSLQRAADPDCLAAKGLEPAGLEGRGRDLLVKWNTQMLEQITGLIDPKVYRERFAAAAGRDAANELDRLKQDATVKRYLQIERPIRLAKIVDNGFEFFERYVLIKRIKLRPVFPLATGNEQLLRQNPTEAAQQELDAFVESADSQALDRFLDLSEQSAAAWADALKRDKVPFAGPLHYFHGVETDLAEICVR